MVGIRPEHPDGETIRWNWNAGVNIDPHDKKTVYLGGNIYLSRLIMEVLGRLYLLT